MEAELDFPALKTPLIFGLVLRLGALYLSFWGGWYTLAGFRYIPTDLDTILTGRSHTHNSLSYFFYGVPILLISVLLLRFAGNVVRFTYRKELFPAPDPQTQAKIETQPPAGSI